MMIDLDEFLDQAFCCFNSGKTDEAEVLLNQIQRISPTHGDILYLKGLIALQKDILSQAYELLSLAVKLYPKQVAYQEALADVYHKMKNYEKAKEIYASLPQNNAIRFKEALIGKNTGNTSKAIQMFKELLPTSEGSQAYFELAFLEENKKLSYLKKSFELSPNSKNATEIIKYLLKQHPNQDIDVYLKYVKSKYILACVDVIKHQYDSALNKLEKHIKDFPYDEAALTLLAQVYEKEKLLDKAEETYKKIIKIDKDSFDGHHLLAKLLMGQGRFSEALDHYQIICRMQPENKEILLAMALLTEHTKNYAEAIGIYFRLVSLGQKNLSNLIQKNILNLAKEDIKLAKKFAQGWVNSFPKSKTAKNLLKKLSVFLFVFLFACVSYADLNKDETQWQILWETKMAETGDPISLFYLGELFEKGEKMPQDYAQAVHYYEKSAAQSYLPACMKLGQIFATHPILKDEKKSIQWYTYAAEKGDVQAEFYLADYYQQRQNKNDIKAKEYLEKALKQTFPNETDFSKVSPQYASLMEKMKQKENTLIERKSK